MIRADILGVFNDNITMGLHYSHDETHIMELCLKYECQWYHCVPHVVVLRLIHDLCLCTHSSPHNRQVCLSATIIYCSWIQVYLGLKLTCTIAGDVSTMHKYSNIPYVACYDDDEHVPECNTRGREVPAVEHKKRKQNSSYFPTILFGLRQP